MAQLCHQQCHPEVKAAHAPTRTDTSIPDASGELAELSQREVVAVPCMENVAAVRRVSCTHGVQLTGLLASAQCLHSLRRRRAASASDSVRLYLSKRQELADSTNKYCVCFENPVVPGFRTQHIRRRAIRQHLSSFDLCCTAQQGAHSGYAVVCTVASWHPILQ